MRALTAISIIVMGAALAACGDSGDGTGGSGGAGGSTVTGSGGSAPTGTGGEAATTGGLGGDTGVGGDPGVGGAGGDTVVGTGGSGGAPPLVCEDPEAPYDCGPDDFCLSYNAVCDGEVDCDNGADEADCTFECGADEYTCPVDGACVSLDFLCDGEDDCSFGEDEDATICEEACGDGEVACADGACIDIDFVCDEEIDCDGGEDEDPGNCSGFVCDSGIVAPDETLAFCLGVNCCLEFEYCADDGVGGEDCVDCLNNDGGELCNAAISCGLTYCL